jgi:hypothetical protein
MQFENNVTSNNIEKMYQISKHGYEERFIDEHGNFCYNFRSGLSGFGRAFCKDCEKEILQHRQVSIIDDGIICLCVENKQRYKKYFW